MVWRQGGAGADDEVQVAERSAGGGGGGVLRAEVNAWRIPHQRRDSGLQHRRGVIFVILLAFQGLFRNYVGLVSWSALSARWGPLFLPQCVSFF